MCHSCSHFTPAAKENQTILFAIGKRKFIGGYLTNSKYLTDVLAATYTLSIGLFWCAMDPLVTDIGSCTH
jgi:hypothetical protein